MFSKRSISILAAAALSVTAGGVALADPMPTSAEIDEVEVSNPASIDFKNRNFSAAGDTNTVWEAVEVETPDSPDYRNRVISSSAGDSNAAWEASEVGSPDTTQPSERAVPEIKSDPFAAARCSTQAQDQAERCR
jgi:hypothetical protein